MFTSRTKKIASVVLAVVMLGAFACMAFATSGETMAESVTNPIIDLINSLLTPLLAVVGALGTLYCVILGVKYAKAEEPQDREKAKSHLKNAIIGFVLIFVLMLALKILTPQLTNWVNTNAVN